VGRPTNKPFKDRLITICLEEKFKHYKDEKKLSLDRLAKAASECLIEDAESDLREHLGDKTLSKKEEEDLKKEAKKGNTVANVRRNFIDTLKAFRDAKMKDNIHYM
jgi:hypothetical protein